MEDKNQEVILEIKDLSISFFNKSGEIQAVRGINYTLHKGEVLGIVGESGSGKSVALKCIAGLIRPDEGRVELDGRILYDSASGIDLAPQKRSVGYLFQQYALFPNMTVLENVLMGFHENEAELRKRLQKHMEELGVLTKGAGKGRALTLAPLEGARPSAPPPPVPEQPEAPVGRVPIVGTVAAGTPILAQECIEDYLTFDTNGREGEYFALRVRGESMLNAGILPGDLVVVHQQPVAHNGEIVVALVEDEATVKRFYKENGHYRLQPENSTMEPIIVDSVLILGKVVALLREY